MNRDWRWYRLVPMFLVMGTIFYLSHQPGDTFHLPEVVNIDKLLHMLVYGVLALSTLYGLPVRMGRQHPRLAAVLVILFCLAYGLSDEWHQSFIPGRFPSFWDIAADTAGAGVAVYLWFKFTALRRNQSLLHQT